MIHPLRRMMFLRYERRCAEKMFKKMMLMTKFKRWTHSGDKSEKIKTIYSGIQPTGVIHLGNYLGAVRNWVKLQEECKDTIYSIADLHSITIPYDHKILPDSIMRIAATLIACGIDPKKSILYQQSQVIEHTSLCWILSCLTTMPRLERLSQFKQKAAMFTNRSVPTGLFIYPVLQAADVLLYKTTHVPVGEDQVQQMQLVGELARHFNGIYGNTFPVPVTIIPKDTSSRILSLRDPSSKMSKSDKNPKSRIELLDSPDEICEKIKKAVTDFTSAVYHDHENRPGVSNLMTIHRSLTGKSYDDIQKENSNIDTGKYKSVLSDIVINYLTPIRSKALELLNEKDYLESILKEGTERAAERASITMQEVFKKTGFVKSD